MLINVFVVVLLDGSEGEFVKVVGAYGTKSGAEEAEAKFENDTALITIVAGPFVIEV